jgi:hypothetical protein
MFGSNETSLSGNWRYPHGPCATFTMEGGQRYAVYQLTRPGAVHHFGGRIDP